MTALESAALPADANDLSEAAQQMVCWVLPENWLALMLYLRCQHQFELAIGLGSGYWSACKSANLLTELRWLGVKPPMQNDVVQKYREIERESLRILNQRLAA